MPPRTRKAPPTLERVMRIAEFRAALQTFLRRGEETARLAGLTPRWYLVLLFIKGASDKTQRMSPAELAVRLKASPNTVTDLVHRVEAAGLVQREPSEHDGRVVLLRLTAEGDRRLAAAIKASERDRADLARELEDLVDLYKRGAEDS